MTKPSLITQIEKILGKELQAAPVRPHDFLGGLMAYKRNTPKYQLWEGELIGLNLANTGLTDGQWQQILEIPEVKPARFLALNLSDNALTTFEVPAGMSALQWLNLSDNSELRSFQIAITLPDLQWLDLQGCALSRFDANLFARLPKIHTLFLRGNQLENISRELYDKPGNVIEDLRNTFEAILEDGEIPNDQVKLLLLGNSTAGKSSLIEFLSKGTYKKKKVTTEGIEQVIWRPYKDDPEASEYEKSLKVAVWDFGGQEFYHNTHSLFFSDNSLYLIVYEHATNIQGKMVTKLYFYENNQAVPRKAELEHFHYRYWLDNVKRLVKGEEVPILMVQNKCDNPPETPIVEVADDCKQEFGLNSLEHIFHISIEQTHVQNPQALPEFERFTARLKTSIKNHVQGFSNSRKWQEIKNTLQEEWKAEKVLSYAEYTRRCEQIKPGISEKEEDQDKSQLDTLTEQLHKQGVLLHYADIPALQDRIFVDPAWVTDCIYRVLDYEVIRSKGRFSREDVERKVATIEGVDADGLLALLRHFQLIFELERGNEQFFVAPQYLPESWDSETQMLVNAFEEANQPQHVFTLSYPDFLPVSTFLKFLAIYGNLNLNYWFNKNELVFTKDHKVVMARCVRTAEKRQISIKIQDRDPALKAELFQKLHELDPNPRIQISADGKKFHPLGQVMNPEFKPVYGERFGFMLEGYLVKNKPDDLPKIFFCWSGSEEDKKLLNQLLTQLSVLSYPDPLAVWNDPPYQPVSPAEQIDLEAADYVLLLLSPDLLRDRNKLKEEVEKAYEWHQEGKTHLVPIALRPCSWKRMPFSGLTELPAAGKFVTGYADRDAAWVAVVEGIERLLLDRP